MKSITKAVLLAVLVAAFISVAVYAEDETISSGAGVTYTITYHVDEECGTLDTLTQEYSGMLVTHPTPEARDGYTFAGWYTYNNGSYSSASNFLRGNVDLYALWYYECDIVYELNGGSLNESNPAHSNSEELSQKTLGTPEYEGHKFYKWYSEEYIVTYSAKTTFTATAVWYYTITYELDGGTNSGSNPQTYIGINTVTLRDPVKSGYEFVGWIDEDGDEVTLVTMRDITVTAVWKELATCTITYHLSDTETYTETYHEGEAKDLYVPENPSGKVFNGWCTAKDDHSTMTVSQSSNVRGDIDYYAWWYDEDASVGTKSTFEVTQVSGNSYQPWVSSSVTVQLTLTVLDRNESGQEYVVRTITSDSGSSTESYWTEGDSDYTYTYQGMVLVNTEVYGQVYCEKWYGTSSSGSVYQYVYEGYILVYMYSSYRDGQYTYTTTYTLKSFESVDIQDEFEIKVSADKGLKVTGAGTYKRGDTVTLTVTIGTGMLFDGWYDADGNLLSSDETYVFEAYYGMTVYAKSATDAVEKTFTWKVGDKTYTYTLTMSTGDYNKSMSGTSVRDRQNTDRLLDFVTPDDKYVQEIATYILSVTEGMDDYDRLTVLLNFVQYIEYKYDSDSTGYDEYYKYPLETLYSQNGDCEDTSILFCSIASAMGYKSAILLFSGHAAGSVSITDGSISESDVDVFPCNGVNYIYCETTTTGWNLGKAPTGYTYKGQYYTYSDSRAINPVEVYHIHKGVYVEGVESTATEEGIVAHYTCETCGKTFADEDCREELASVVTPRKLPADVDAGGDSITLSAAEVKNSADGGETLTIRFEDGYLGLSDSVMEYLASTGQEVEINLSVVDTSALTEAQSAVIGSARAYSVELFCGNESVHDLGSSVTISFVYIPSSKEETSTICIYYVDSEGNVQKVENAEYSDGYITFAVDHFSVYMVGHESSGDGSNNFDYAIIGISIVVFLGIAGVTAIRRH